ARECEDEKDSDEHGISLVGPAAQQEWCRPLHPKSLDDSRRRIGLSETCPRHVAQRQRALSHGGASPRQATLGIALANADVMGGKRWSALWCEILDGRWIMIDHFDHRGRRHLIARRNNSRAGGLSLRERAVAARASHGQS